MMTPTRISHRSHAGFCDLIKHTNFVMDIACRENNRTYEYLGKAGCMCAQTTKNFSGVVVYSLELMLGEHALCVVRHSSFNFAVRTHGRVCL